MAPFVSCVTSGELLNNAEQARCKRPSGQLRNKRDTHNDTEALDEAQRVAEEAVESAEGEAEGPAFEVYYDLDRWI